MLKQKWLKVVIAVALFIAIWWLIAILSNSKVFPTPWDTIKACFDLITTPKTWKHVGISTYRTVVGTLLGCVIGTILGLTTKYSDIMDTFVRVIVYPLFQSIPTICWAFIFVIWFGLSEWTPILSVMTAVAPFFMINIWEGLKEMDMNLVEMGNIYTKNRFKVLTKIILPMLYPFIFAAIKSGFIVAWKVVILGEIYGSASGMGYMLSLAFSSFQMARVFAWTLGFAAILILFDKVVFEYIERRFIRKWQIKK